MSDRESRRRSPRELASVIDHTILAPEATRSQLDDAASVAVERGCASLCVAPEHVAHVRHVVADRIPVCAVVGFPHGTHVAAVKAAEASAAVAHGASELDMVIALGPVAEGDLAHVAHEVAVVREAVPDVVLKVIVESALWPSAVLRDLTVAAIDGGADLVKTSTGFHPAGGASPDAVRVMAAAAAGRAGVKASGGLRTLRACLDVLDAGATRLGLSATVPVLEECSASFGSG